MRNLFFCSFVLLLALTSCFPRIDQRQTRYDPQQCPICITEPATCTYCAASGTCIYCNGEGIRTTVTPNLPMEGIKSTGYEEECPFCKSTGICQYCNGSKQCWACEGEGTVSEWNFFEKYQQRVASLEKPVLPQLQPAEADTLSDTSAAQSLE